MGKKYGDESLNNFIYSIIKIDDNTIVIGIGKYTEFISPYTPANEWTKSWIFAIDSIGNLKWDWESALNEGTYVAGLQSMPDGGFMYASASFQIHDPWEWGSRPKIVRRDSNFSLLWERDVCLSSAPNNIIYDLKPTPDGHFIAVGSWVLPDYPPEPPGAWKGGCLYKISSGGDSIWTYCDTVPNTIEALGGVVVLSSGSIVAAGNVTRSWQPSPRSWGWLLKTDRDGCVDTLCNLVNTFSEAPRLPGPKVFPNPVQAKLRVELEGVSFFRSRLFNAQGQKVYETASLFSNADLDMTDFPSGFYILEIQWNGGRHVEKVVKVD